MARGPLRATRKIGRPAPGYWSLFLHGARRRCLAGDIGPRGNQGIETERVIGPAAAFADRVEPVGEVSCGIGQTADLVNQLRSLSFAAVVPYPFDELLRDFPHWNAAIARRVPVVRELVASQKTHPASARHEDPRLFQTLDRDVRCPGEPFCRVIASLVEAVPVPARL